MESQNDDRLVINIKEDENGLISKMDDYISKKERS